MTATTIATIITPSQIKLPFSKATLIRVRGFEVSIGSFNTSEVAIFSLSTGEAVSQSVINRSKRFRKIKRKFKHFLSCENQFFFSHMSEGQTMELIQMLK